MSHLHCIEYTTNFLVCGHSDVSTTPCHYHERLQKELYRTPCANGICGKIPIRITALRMCAHCRSQNPWLDEFCPGSPIKRYAEHSIQRPKTPESFQTTAGVDGSVQSETSSSVSDESTDYKHGWNPRNDTKETRRRIGIFELQNLEVQLQREFQENPVACPPKSTEEEIPEALITRCSIARQKAARRRPARLSMELPLRQTTARSILLVYAKPELVELNRGQEVYPILPSRPRALPSSLELGYQPYRRPSTTHLLDSPSANVPSVTLTHAEEDAW